MKDFLIPLIGSGIVVAYWYICRIRSLAHREKAAGLLTDYFNRHSVSEKDKDDAERFYMMARSWAFMPAMTLVVFPVLLVRALIRRPDRVSSKERLEITDAVMKMYLSRNPITGTICLALFSLAAVMAVFIGLLINRVRAVPSAPSAYMAATRFARPVTWRHHA
ncbi:hypothetical protein [Pseudomonas sp. QD4]|uniref:hypothetical protein n=1 Tax=Pseudomonas sp. QD4 TaxID=3368618 RepID=UPI003BA0750E